MYAIVKTGGKQFKAAENEIIVVEKLDGEVGTKVEMTEVVLIANGDKVKVGSPLVTGAKVVGTIVRQAKGPKIVAFNYKAKKNERKRWGHRQQYTQVRIEKIEAGK
ncbi:MAG: 50S ribosomal protein L21 [Armatimonadetes bacterium]|jgi:large subunit ribosomal protein L21|nr:50S ribosomal protein L21 [Armatimonadota bacterium]